MSSQQQGPPPPPSYEETGTNLNTAPQSFLNPFKASGGTRKGQDALQPTSASARATYLRRVTRPDLPEPAPTRFQRGMGVLAVVSSVAAGVYMVFFMDWHRDQHAFKDLRKWAGTEKYQIDLWPTTNRDDWYKQTGFTREELIKMVGEEELEKAAPPKSGAGTMRKKIGIEDIRRQRNAAAAGAGENQTTPHQPQPPLSSSSSTTTTPILDSVKGAIWTRERAQ